LAIPAKPARFHPELAPDGVEVRFVTFWQDRPRMPAPPRLQLVHTNAAAREGSIQASWNWAHARPNSNTCPHYQIDRDGRARKMLPTNRRGIGNATESYAEGAFGDVSWWSLVYETADTGTIADPGISDFTAAQAETLATILAYEAVVSPAIPLAYPVAWHGPGTACHTEPYGHPYWTIEEGKTCPGSKKKASVRGPIMNRAREIWNNWTQAPPPPPPAPPGIVDVIDYGWFQLHDSLRWPYGVAQAFYGDGNLWPWVVNFNGLEADLSDWPPDGGYVKIPSLPKEVTKAPQDSKFAGVRVRTPVGAAAAEVIGIAYPNESFQQRQARVPAWAFWNGGSTATIAGEVVFCPA
jgi:hypothetical protein